MANAMRSPLPAGTAIPKRRPGESMQAQLDRIKAKAVKLKGKPAPIYTGNVLKDARTVTKGKFLNG